MPLTAVRFRAVVLQLLRFGATGVLNTVVGLATIWFCWRVLGLPTLIANVIGYSVGLCFSFLFNRAWTFRSDRSVRHALPRFLLVFGVSYLLNLATLLVLTEGLHVRVEWATLAANVPYSLAFYAGSRWFAFAPESLAEDDGPWKSARGALP